MYIVVKRQVVCILYYFIIFFKYSYVDGFYIYILSLC